MSKRITMDVSVDIDMSDFDDDDLMDEINSRGLMPEEKELITDELNTPQKVRSHLIEIFKLQKWATSDQIKAEIDIIYNLT